MTIDLENIEAVELLRPQPGDVLVLRHPHVLYAEGHARLKASLREHLHTDIKVIVLEQGAQLSLLRTEGQPQVLLAENKRVEERTVSRWWPRNPNVFDFMIGMSLLGLGLLWIFEHVILN